MKLPDDFILGASTSAFQIEGALEEDGRGPSIWDHFSGPSGDTGAVACDHYHRYETDVEWMSRLNLHAYRFSIAWPRIFPRGEGQVNSKGLDFYSRLIDKLLEHDIQPWPTLYHWELPLALEEKGGWENRETAHRFADYAELVVSKLGDRATNWFTLNEPWSTIVLGYQTGQHAPGKKLPTCQALKASHHLFLAHGQALRRIRSLGSEHKAGIILNPWIPLPLTRSEEDLEAAKRAWKEQVSWWFDPIFAGRYPDENSVRGIREGDMKLISQPIDHLGLNMYFPGFVRASRKHDHSYEDYGPVVTLPRSEMGWPTYPAGLSFLLQEVDRRYSPPSVYITENGCAAPDLLSDRGEVHDLYRQDYIRAHLKEALETRAQGVPVKGYFVWSLMDNFEWDQGYGKRFGLLNVDYDSLNRTMKRSGNWYSQVCLRRELLGEPLLGGEPPSPPPGY